MLNTPAPFPQPGSWALFGYDGETKAVRIVLAPLSVGTGTAFIAIADRPVTASGNLTVPVEQLLDPTPLDSAERAELAALDAYISARVRPKRDKVDRANALHERSVRAETLVNLLEQLERRGLATPASREARRCFEAAIAAGMRRKAA